jgi:hypothetical protein
MKHRRGGSAIVDGLSTFQQLLKAICRGHPKAAASGISKGVSDRESAGWRGKGEAKSMDHIRGSSRGLSAISEVWCLSISIQ